MGGCWVDVVVLAELVVIEEVVVGEDVVVIVGVEVVVIVGVEVVVIGIGVVVVEGVLEGAVKVGKGVSVVELSRGSTYKKKLRFEKTLNRF